jgi:hypothetical protein
MIKNLISVPLRYALITILLVIIFTTGLTITLVCLRQNLENRKDFAHAIGYQLSLNINQNLERLIYEIEDFINTTAAIYKNTNLDGTNNKVFLHALADHLIENPRYGVIVYKDEKTDRTFILDPPINKQFKYGSIHSPSKEVPDNSSTDEKIILREYIPSPINGTFTKKKYLIENYPNNPMETISDLQVSFNDKPWYLLGKSLPAKSKSMWTEAFNFKNADNVKKHGSGIHCVKSLFDKNGNLAAVISMDIGNYLISDYLTSLLDDVHTENLKGFILEKRQDGSNVLIAHSLRDETFPRDEKGNLILIRRYERPCNFITDSKFA